MMGKAGDMMNKAKDLVGNPAKTVKITVTVDMRKEFGEEQVDVTVKDFTTDVKLFQTLLSINMARVSIEQAISEKASEVATKLAKEKVDKVTGVKLDDRFRQDVMAQVLNQARKAAL